MSCEVCKKQNSRSILGELFSINNFLDFLENEQIDDWGAICVCSLCEDCAQETECILCKGTILDS